MSTNDPPRRSGGVLSVGNGIDMTKLDRMREVVRLLEAAEKVALSKDYQRGGARFEDFTPDLHTLTSLAVAHLSAEENKRLRLMRG